MNLYESLVGNLGIGPHIANQHFFEKMTKKRSADKIAYFRRFVKFFEFDQDKLLKSLRHSTQEYLKHSGTEKEIVTNDWFEWRFNKTLNIIEHNYFYDSAGAYKDEYYRNQGDYWFHFDFDNQKLRILISDNIRDSVDKLKSFFKKSSIYRNEFHSYWEFDIKDSIKDLSEI